MRRILISLVLGMALECACLSAYGQGTEPGGTAGASCVATRVVLNIGTGGDDLRGGKNNLNIQLLFTDHTVQAAPNVNYGHNWPNNSVHEVEILLKHPVPVTDIKEMRLFHIADGSINLSAADATLAAPVTIPKGIQTDDNWDMAYLVATAMGRSGSGRWEIASYRAFRFTGSNPALVIPTSVRPASAAASCAGNSGGGNGSSGGIGSSSAEGGDTPLTNNDVIRMVKGGLPGSVIMSLIRSRSGDFDLSNKAKTDLLAAGGKGPAGETTAIWDTMTNAMIAKATNGRGGEEVSPPNPLPNSPKDKSNISANGAQPGKQFVLPKNLKIFTIGEVRNPAALPLLRNGTQLQGSAGGNVGPEQTMSATGNSSSKNASSAAASSRTLGGPAAMQPSGDSHRLAAVSANVATVCLNKAGIAAVNGTAIVAPFTPGGHYVITGCGFGSTPGKVYLTGGFPAHNGKVELGPYYQFGTTRGWPGHWSDREIDAQLDEGLSGELDQNSISLVVETSTGQQIQLTGLNFNAQRAEFMLAQLPSSSFGFDPNPTGTAESPCTPSWVTSNCTVDVLRNYFGTAPTPDRYTINLKTGFALSRVVLLVMSQSEVTNFTTPQINGNQIVVNWNWTKESTGFTYSLYGLQIYVVGPLGVTDALWAGK